MKTNILVNGSAPRGASFQAIAKAMVKVMALMALLVAVACDSFLEVGTPKNQLGAQAVFEEQATADAAVADIFSRMRDSGLLSGKQTGTSVLLAGYADEMDFYGFTGNGAAPFFSNALVATDPVVKEIWSAGYAQAYAANAAIEGLEKSEALAEEQKAPLMGEALFARAVVHFYMAACFGAVPYVTATGYEANSHIVKRSQQEVFAMARLDLETAIGNLPEQYRTPERVRPNRAAAQALLARICLYAGDWNGAERHAGEVIAQAALYDFPAALDETFLKGAPSTIWQFAPIAPGKNTDEAQSFSFLSGPPPICAMAPALLQAFESGDARKQAWTKAVTDGTAAWYHAAKYRQFQNTGASVEYSIVLRLQEQYLIRAEARARLGNLQGAKEDLDAVRGKAGLGPSPAATLEEMLDALLAERRVELFSEFGHRFFDLRRMGKIDAALSHKPDWSQSDSLWPLPQSELLLNPGLAPQNTGY